MNTLRLSFQSLESPQLTMVEYVSSIGEKRVSLRGKSGSSLNEYFSFQWTSAVKALACLCLRASIFGLERASISGDSNSLASALDYALSKPPQWLVDMFGLDSKGESYSKRLFKRINPERKRPGPVSINLYPNLLKDNGIEIFFAGAKLNDQREVKALYYSVLDSINVREEDLGSSEELINLDENLFYKQIYEKEIRDSLISTKIFSPTWSSKYLKHVSSDPLFLKINSPHVDSLNALVDRDSASARLAICDYQYLSRLPSTMPRIKIYTSICATGFIALSEYLKQILNIPIDLHYYYPYGVEVVDQVKPLAEESDYVLCCTGFGPTAEFFSNPNKGFVPMMFGPTMTHRLVKPTLGSFKSSGEYLFVSDSATSAMFCFDSLIREGKLNKKNIRITHCEPEDTILSLDSNPEARALFWFPHYKILTHLGAVEIVEDDSSSYAQSTVIFANKTSINNKRVFSDLKLLYRHAWLSMLENRSVISQVSDMILSDKSFIKFVNRCAGVHYLGA